VQVVAEEGVQVLVPAPQLARHQAAPVADGVALGVQGLLAPPHEALQVRALLLQHGLMRVCRGAEPRQDVLRVVGVLP